MSTKKRYNLAIQVNTLPELLEGPEDVQVDISVYGIQIVNNHTQFTDLNNTDWGL